MKALRSTTTVPLVLVGIVLLMVIPISPRVLDLLLAANITVAILILVGTMLLKDSLDFSVFPSLLLITTMGRLALNVTSTRLILLDGDAGRVIETFGTYVVGGSIVVGLVVFLILIVIQFVVITNGSSRVAEVAARFTLDAMPGKQMAIDADLASGLIDESQARAARKRIAQEADFHGAMDGASKFVKGDAIASLIIVGINLIGGLAIGMAMAGMTFSEASSTYVLLSVGDGLVSQIPALLISISTGLLVTRVSNDENVGSQIGSQLFGRRRALLFAGVAVAGMALFPGFPKVPFAIVAAVLFFLSTRLPDSDDDAADSEPEETARVVSDPEDPEVIIGEMRVEPLELHLSYDILDLIDSSSGGDLLDRVRSLRHQIALELGIVMPLVRTRDDVSLPTNTYSIVLRGTEVGRGTAPRDQILALPIDDGSELRGLGGAETLEPVFGLAAFWVPEAARATAAATGATVVDRSSVLVTHLAEVVRTNAASLLSRQDVQLLVEGLRYEEPVLANEVGSEHFPLSLFHEVLRALLRERVSIRDLGPIVEAVSSKVTETRSVEQLVAAARIAVGRTITAGVAREGKLGVITLEPALEAELHESIRDADGTSLLAIDSVRLTTLQRDIEQAATESARQGVTAALVCGAALRAPLQRTVTSMGFDLVALAYPELPPDVDLVPIGAIGVRNAEHNLV